MTTGTWDPSSPLNDKSSYRLDIDFLKDIIQRVKKTDFILQTEFNVSALLSAEEEKQHAGIMQLDKNDWEIVDKQFSDEEIIILIKFFTLAEIQFTYWKGEKTSPVIWLSKLIRRRGKALDKELLVWIKSTSTNKFLPYGPL